ncbi:MAG: DNA polymerase III subunit delta' [Clostridia bacterium]|nr:DNA polymerase III subunit delta' [Clostridia bacterium]
MAQAFSAILGNEAVKARLTRALRDGTLPHALILSGPEGSGRRTLARELAAALFCLRRGEDAPLPCGECEACRKVREGIFPDLHVIAPEEGKTTIGIARIRELRAELALTANESTHRVFIIERAEAMNAAAQNALLVSLEEPPEGVVILLITESEEALLPTVRSRCQLLRTELFDAAALERHLASNERFATLARRSPERAEALLESAGGCLGRALLLLDEGKMAEVLSEREAVDAVIRALGARGSAELFSALRLLPSTKREELTEALALLSDALRDLILLKRDPTAPLVYYYDRETALTLAESVGIQRLFRLSDAVAEAEDDLSRNANVPIVLSTLLYAVAAR